jgi:hypothetical protein
MKKHPEQAAAEVVYKFCHAGDKADTLAHPHHDKESGLVIATDSSSMIATVYGFNPAAAVNVRFPWKGIFPTNTEEQYPHTVYILKPSRLQKICNAAARLAEAAGSRAEVWFKVAGHVCLYDAARLANTLEAMEANGARLLRFSTAAPDEAPLYVETTTKATRVLQMPLRSGGYGANAIHIDGERCQLAPPPEEEPRQLPVLWREWNLWRALNVPAIMAGIAYAQQTA